MQFLLLLKLVRGARRVEVLGKWEVTVGGGWAYTSKIASASSMAERGLAQPTGTHIDKPTGIQTHPKTSWNIYKNHSPFIKDLYNGNQWMMLTIYIIVVALQTVATIVYFGARAFVVVEAFLSLRRLPKGVYNKVWWVELIPHF